MKITSSRYERHLLLAIWSNTISHREGNMKGMMHPDGWADILSQKLKP
jgi:hypothetical protein